ncbi:MAG: DUF4178 domain-containing protein [Deltaproteobacteria bacterium]|nr:MAG: DUF4178 domain-containing protein [Deltaproteobacteria bacterium]
MFTGLIIALLAVVGAGVVVWGGMNVLASRSDRALPDGDTKLLGAGSDTPLLERTVRDVRVGDVIQRDGADWVVEGVVQYDEDGHRWRGARLDDGARERWMLVGLDRGGAATVRWLVEREDVQITGYPPEALAVDGATFRQNTRGTATARVMGDAGSLEPTAPEGPDSVTRCRWWSYSAAGSATLVVEQWGDAYRVLHGERLRPDDIELMPGS